MFTSTAAPGELSRRIDRLEDQFWNGVVSAAVLANGLKEGLRLSVTVAARPNIEGRHATG